MTTIQSQKKGRNEFNRPAPPNSEPIGFGRVNSRFDQGINDSPKQLLRKNPDCRAELALAQEFIDSRERDFHLLMGSVLGANRRDERGVVEHERGRGVIAHQKPHNQAVTIDREYIVSYLANAIKENRQNYFEPKPPDSSVCQLASSVCQPIRDGIKYIFTIFKAHSALFVKRN